MNSPYTYFKEEALLLESQFPELKLVEQTGEIPKIIGEVILRDVDGERIDSYSIEMVCSSNYPQSFPFVFETNNRIPLNIDWHVHSDGHACLCSWPEEIIHCNKGINLESYLKKHVIPYFFNQKHREVNGFFVKERAHGNEGNIEFLKEKFRTNNCKTILSCLEYIRANPEPDRTNNCFCGSGEKFRKCHREEFREFKELSYQTIDQFILLIKITNPFLWQFSR